MHEAWPYQVAVCHSGERSWVCPWTQVISFCCILLLHSVSNLKPVVVQSLSCVSLFSAPRTAAHQASLSFTISWSLLQLLSIESMMPSSHLILCCFLLLPSVSSVFSSELENRPLCIRWRKYWSFSVSISPSNEYSRLISFRIAVQGAFKSLLQHHSSKASILWCSAFFMVQLSYDYWKSHSLTMRTFIGKVMSLLVNVLSRFVIAFLPSSKRLNFMAAVTICSDFGAHKNEICHCFLFSPFCLP